MGRTKGKLSSVPISSKHGQLPNCVFKYELTNEHSTLLESPSKSMTSEHIGLLADSLDLNYNTKIAGTLYS